MLSCCFLCIYNFYNLIVYNYVFYISVHNWIDTGLFYVQWTGLFDNISISMLFMVSFISLIVHIYSGGYMESDPSFQKFLSYLSLFTFLMFLLITSDNYIQLFFGWEGVGICSYLLISFWNTRINANKAALKALIMNRIGDFGFLIGILLIFYIFRSLDFSVVFSLITLFEKSSFILLNFNIIYIQFICLFLFLGSCGKSAQLLLHTWLPDAMEGPTPVSALIHAATMVTAGIFLIIRCSILFESSSYVLTVITFIGVFTAFFASTIGLFQYDIKKVIAYSTCSQLGYMIFICGISQYHASIFHLINHAFFKALLFLTAGAVIHALSGEQDMRRMGSLLKIIPFTYTFLVVGSFALAGFPFLSGFYSKDFILELTYSSWTFDATLAYWLGSFSAILTAFYSFRVIYLVFFSKNNSYIFYLKNIHELPKSMAFSLIILGLGSIFFGFFVKDFFIGFGSFYWHESIYIKSQNYLHFDIEFIPLIIKNIPLFFTFFGFILGWFWFYIYYKYTLYYYSIKLIKFFNSKWYFDFIYNKYFAYKLYNIAYKYTYILLDKGIFELFGAKGIIQFFYKSNFLFKKMQSGFLYQYQCFFLISVFIFSIFCFI